MSLAPTVMRRVVDQAPAYGELYLTFPEHVALRTFLENNPHASVRITEGQTDGGSRDPRRIRPRPRNDHGLGAGPSPRCPRRCAPDAAPERGAVMSRYIVCRRTISTGRLWYVSRRAGIGWTADRAKARLFPDAARAARWAAMERSDLARGVGGQDVFVCSKIGS